MLTDGVQWCIVVTVQLSKIEFVDCANVSGGVWIVIRFILCVHLYYVFSRVF